MTHAHPRRFTILLAGGGSGGHVSPGLAIAERLAEREADEAGAAERPAVSPNAIFVCSERAIDAHMLRSAAVRHVPIPARPPSLRPLGAVAFLRAFRASRARCARLLCEDGVDQVLALGGFVSAPAVSAARACGVPVTLLNLDRPPGRANRWTARRSDRVWSAVDLPDQPGFAERVVGMPLRRCALAPAGADECRRRLGLDPDRPTLLVTGASQGATSLNALLTTLARRDPALFEGWQVLHLAGRRAVDEVREAYDAAGATARVEPFLDEIGLAWGAADLAVSRAGASSVAEVAANAVPALFLPYPHHRDRHQVHNARPLVEAGGAALEEDLIDPTANADRAGRTLRALMGDPERRAAMRAALTGRETPDAAAHIVDLLLTQRPEHA